ncbi:dienelactone hydrolase family protein [bacterium]|nr:dienelactone hydrolase family protein [bacterium]
MRRSLTCLLLAALAGSASARTVVTEIRTLPENRGWLWEPRGYSKDKEAYGLVIVLHPAGIGGQRYLKVWGEIANRTGEFIVMAPEAADVKRRMWALNDEGRTLAAIKQVVGAYRIDPRRILLTGFSQGGIYTYTFGLRNPHMFRALAPAGGALVARPSPASAAILERAKALPVYISHGGADDRIPVARARAARDRLEKAGYRVTYHETPYQGHTFSSQEAHRIWNWFKAATDPRKAVRGE